MRMSRHVGMTMKETPKEAQVVSHQLMLRAGYIKQLMAGVYDYLPLMQRVLMKISQIVREEMNAKYCEEVLLPALQPKELWLETERWERYTDIDGIMFSFTDRRKSDVCLGPTHEEVITDLARNQIRSAKELPVNLYQIQTKFRDEIRPRFGLMRAREFIMKDAYSFDKDEAGMVESFNHMYEAYCAICDRIGVEYRSVDADAGAIGGDGSKEFMVIAETGEDTILYCDSCDYAANVEKATSRLPETNQDDEMKPMEAVHGPNIIGVEPLAEFLNIPVEHTTKTMLYQADDKVVAVMVRGGCDVNEIKVQNYLGCKQLALATPETVKEVTGAEVGYAGPVGLPESVQVLADDYTNNRINFECGANQTDYHNINVNFERDFPMPTFGDFKSAKEGDICPCCEGKLKEAKGIEVGHIFQLRTKYSEKLKCTYLDESGAEKPMYMGCYGVGVSRMAAATIEQNHDDRGIIWPLAIAPYQVHLVALNTEQEEVKTKAEEMYQTLRDSDIEVLYDDRDDRPGAKFADADLIGLPFRITISKKSMEQGMVEFKLRTEKDFALIPFEEATQKIQDAMNAIKMPKIYLG